jgi:hypothetical protein
MAFRKFLLKHYQDDGVSGSSRGEIVLENFSSNRFWINVKEVAGLLRLITFAIANAERLGACIADGLPSTGTLFAHYCEGSSRPSPSQGCKEGVHDRKCKNGLYNDILIIMVRLVV